MTIMPFQAVPYGLDGEDESRFFGIDEELRATGR
jgi:hypothetical protein